MVTQWKKSILKINEIYGKGRKDTHFKKGDIHAYFQQPEPIITKKRFTIHRQSLHLCIDLCKSEEMLLKEMGRTTRYKIRRAKRDNVTITYIEKPNIDDAKTFARFYNNFAKTKGIETCKLEKLTALMDNNMLVMSYVSHEDGRILSYSATIANNGTAIGLYGASARFKYKDISGQFISRANRYLHWCEMIYFKQLGYHTFDLMGLTMDEKNTDHQKVNEYKRSFGGEEIVQYQSFIPQNILGVCFILVLKHLWRNNPEVIRNKQLLNTEYSQGIRN